MKQLVVLLVLLVVNQGFGATKHITCTSTRPDPSLDLDLYAEDSGKSTIRINVSQIGARSFQAEKSVVASPIPQMKVWQFSSRDMDGTQILKLTLSDARIYNARYASVDRFNEDRVELPLDCKFSH